MQALYSKGSRIRILIIVLCAANIMLYAKEAENAALMQNTTGETQVFQEASKSSSVKSFFNSQVFGTKTEAKKEEVDVEELITDATEYAVKAEEQYVLMTMKKELKDYSNELDAVRNEKDIWIKVSCAEACLVVVGTVIGIACIKKK